ADGTIDLKAIANYLKGIERSQACDSLDQLLLFLSVFIKKSDGNNTARNGIAERIITEILLKPDAENSSTLIDNILQLPKLALTFECWEKLLNFPLTLSAENLNALLARCLATLPPLARKKRAEVLAQQCEIGKKYCALADRSEMSTKGTDGHALLYELAIQSQNLNLLQFIQPLTLQIPKQMAQHLKKDVFSLLKLSLDIDLTQKIGVINRFKKDDYLSIYLEMLKQPECLHIEGLLKKILNLIEPCKQNFDKILLTIQPHLQEDLSHTLSYIFKANPLLQQEPYFTKCIFDETLSICKDLVTAGTEQQLMKPLNRLSAFYKYLMPLINEDQESTPTLNNGSADLRIKYFFQFQQLANCLDITPSEYAYLLYGYTRNFQTHHQLEYLDQLTNPKAMMTEGGLDFISKQICKECTPANTDFLFQFYLALNSSIDTRNLIAPYFIGILEMNTKAGDPLFKKTTLTPAETEYLLVLTLFNALSTFILGNRFIDTDQGEILDAVKQLRIKASDSLILEQYPIGSAIPEEFLEKYGVIFLASEYEKPYSKQTSEQIKRLKEAMSLFNPDSTPSISHGLFLLIFKAICEQIKTIEPQQIEKEQINDLRHSLTTLISRSKPIQPGSQLDIRQNQIIYFLHLIITPLCENYKNVEIMDLLVDKDLIKDWILTIALSSEKANALVYLLRRAMIMDIISRETSQTENSELLEMVIKSVNAKASFLKESEDDDMVRTTLQEVYSTLKSDEGFNYERHTGSSLGKQIDQLMDNLCTWLKIGVTETEETDA
ncbi:MAG: hypothetical protein EB127_17850, partial [Alphaproteobacteria bacterium]|nr:hypothetical protein [Alphaproteobacteria bacterium]